MRCAAVLELAYANDGLARQVAAALRPDDDPFLRTSTSGAIVTARAEADSPLSLARALEDFLACTSVTERTLGIVRARRHPDGPGQDSGPPVGPE